MSAETFARMFRVPPDTLNKQVFINIHFPSQQKKPPSAFVGVVTNKTTMLLIKMSQETEFILA
jgi:hypothetical protein